MNTKRGSRFMVVCGVIVFLAGVLLWVDCFVDVGFTFRSVGKAALFTLLGVVFMMRGKSK